MARAGMCSVCGTNVWLAESGDCQSGHDASCISGVYEADIPVASGGEVLGAVRESASPHLSDRVQTAGGAAPIDAERGSLEQLSNDDVDRLATLELTAHLSAGRFLPVVADSGITLVEGECLHYEVPYGAWVFCGADVQYSKSYLAVGGGSVLGVAALGATLGGSALFNQHKKSRAAAQAAPQWRFVENGVLHITNGRFGMAGQTGWRDIWFDHIRKIEIYPDGLVVYLDGAEPLKIGGIAPYWLWAVYTWLTRGQIVQMPYDAEFEERVHRAGRSLPEGLSPLALPPGD